MSTILDIFYSGHAADIAVAVMVAVIARVVWVMHWTR